MDETEISVHRNILNATRDTFGREDDNETNQFEVDFSQRIKDMGRAHLDRWSQGYLLHSHAPFYADHLGRLFCRRSVRNPQPVDDTKIYDTSDYTTRK